MICIVASWLTALLNPDKVADGSYKKDNDYATTLLGLAWLMEIATEIMLLIRLVVKKVRN